MYVEKFNSNDKSKIKLIEMQSTWYYTNACLHGHIPLAGTLIEGVTQQLAHYFHTHGNIRIMPWQTPWKTKGSLQNGGDTLKTNTLCT